MQVGFDSHCNQSTPNCDHKSSPLLRHRIGLGRFTYMRSTKQSFIKYSILVILFLILFIDLYYFFEYSEPASELFTRSIDKDGFCGFPTKSREDEQSIALQKLPDNYVFLDYEYTIHTTALSTFHRDVTSSQHLYNCANPVYTLIVYEYGGDLVSICPASEQTWPFVWSRIVNISGPPGTCILFNSEILHAGQINHCRPRLARQYKLCHREDIKKLQHLQGTRAKKDTECVDTSWSRMKRKVSYYFAFPINHLFYPFLMRKWEPDTLMGQMQSWLPDHQFYNNI